MNITIDTTAQTLVIPTKQSSKVILEILKNMFIIDVKLLLLEIVSSISVFMHVRNPTTVVLLIYLG